MNQEKFKTQIQQARIKNTRTISYRKYGVPAIIIEGKWLKDIYGWNIGDQVNVIYEPGEIKIQKLYSEDTQLYDKRLARKTSKVSSSPESQSRMV